MSQARDICLLLVRELEGFRREVALFEDDDALWRVVPGVTNSAGNLALHVAGNLRHFVGASLGHTGYVRDRTAEFGTRAGTREHVDRELKDAIAAVIGTLEPLDDEALKLPAPGAPNGMVVRTGLFLLHLVSHTGFHLGQAGYVRRALSGEGAASAGPQPLDVLRDADLAAT
jgi:hypothetical protein